MTVSCGHETHNVLLRLLNTDVHRFSAHDLPEVPTAVDDRGGCGLFQDRYLSAQLDSTHLDTSDIDGQPNHPVAVEA